MQKSHDILFILFANSENECLQHSEESILKIQLCEKNKHTHTHTEATQLNRSLEHINEWVLSIQLQLV